MHIASARNRHARAWRDHMSPKTGRGSAATTGDEAASTAGTAAARPEPRAGRSRARARRPMPLRSFAQATGARALEPQGPADTEPVMRSFHLRVGLVERAKATADGAQHRAYGTAI